MSRIGRKPISLPTGVTVTVSGSHVSAKGPKGTLEMTVHKDISVKVDGQTVLVESARPDERSLRALWGLDRALLANTITGVHAGFEKKLEIKGVGFKAALQGKNLVLAVGFSHPVTFTPPDQITIAVEKNVITVSGIDKQMVGETAANIRKIKKPEPYKGKGIRYVGEYVRQKEGKVVKAAAG